MTAILLILFAAGIAITQTASNPKQVTLNWLRLGGIIAISMLTVSATAMIILNHININQIATTLAPAIILSATQLTLAQLAKPNPQRIAAALTAIACTLTALHWLPIIGTQQTITTWHFAIALPLSAALLGGYLMVMLLGHAYLTQGHQMTQKPFLHLTIILAIILLARTIASITLATLPYFQNTTSPFAPTSANDVWHFTMIIARFAVGILIPAVFTYMVYHCVRRRANQSATGILYVAGVLIILGEGAAIALWNATALPF